METKPPIMQTIEIQSGQITATNTAQVIKQKAEYIFVKGLQGNCFDLPPCVDNGLLRIGNDTFHVGDGFVFAKPCKEFLVDQDKHHFDEVYEIVIE